VIEIMIGDPYDDNNFTFSFETLTDAVEFIKVIFENGYDCYVRDTNNNK